MNYTKQQFSEKAWRVTVDVEGQSHTFDCVVAHDESELDDLINHRVEELRAEAAKPVVAVKEYDIPPPLVETIAYEEPEALPPAESWKPEAE